MKMILFNQNPMITKLLESVSKKLELPMENFNRYQELSTRLKEDPEWILIADDECLEKLDQVDWLELKEIISQNKNSVCMYKKGHEAQPFLEGFEMKIKKPFLPTEVLKVLQKKLGSNASELEPSQNLDPAQEVLETNWDELENLGDLEALVQEEPNNEEQLLPTLNNQKEKEEIKEEVKETPQEEEKPKDDEIQEGETLKDEEVSKELETQEEIKEETQEQAKEQEPIKEETQEIKEEKQEETQEIKEEKQEKTQDSPSAQELEAMQELVKEIQENSNGQEDKKETQENTETPQENAETPQESAETPQESAETPQDVETPQEKETQELETQESTEIPQEKTQEKETQKLGTPQEEIQENTEKTQKLEAQKDHYESIEDIPEPVMAQAMGEKLPFLNESVAKTSNNENDTETPKESVIKTPQEKEGSDKTSNPLELRLNLQDLLKSLNQESLKSLLENKTLSIKITLEDKKPDA
ncbi:chemotaxis regulatory protein ChePep [Helicobacter pylori]